MPYCYPGYLCKVSDISNVCGIFWVSNSTLDKLGKSLCYCLTVVSVSTCSVFMVLPHQQSVQSPTLYFHGHECQIYLILSSFLNFCFIAHDVHLVGHNVNLSIHKWVFISYLYTVCRIVWSSTRKP